MRSSFHAYRESQRFLWGTPVGLVVAALVFGFAILHGRQGLADCESACTELGHDHVVYASGTRMRPDSCRCCDRDWTPEAVCVDAQQLAAGAPLERPRRR